MKAELQLDTTQLIDDITNRVIRALKPLIEQRKAVDDTIFTVETLAEYLTVSKQWVYERVSLHEIPHIKVGKFPRFKKREIDQWLDSQKIPASQTFSGHLVSVK